MGDWEDYCLSVGSNAGDEGMYDDNDSDSPSPPVRKVSPPTEVSPSVNREELVAALVEGTVKGGWEVDIEEHARIYGGDGNGNRADPTLSNFDGHPDSPCVDFSFRIDYRIFVPLTSLIDAMRSSGVPLLQEGGNWLAWDVDKQCVSTLLEPIEWIREREDAARKEEPTDFQEVHLRRLFRSMALCTDHGKKPLLLHKEYLEYAVDRREVKFDEGYRQIRGDAVDEYVLAYYDVEGKIVSIPLKQAVELGETVCTRTGDFETSSYRELTFTPRLSYAKLLVDAFHMATRVNPNRFKWFVARKQGTLFQSAIEQIEAPRESRASAQSAVDQLQPRKGYSSYGASPDWRDPPRRNFATNSGKDALVVATELAEWAVPLGQVYITPSGHPLDAEHVTTPELYRHAVNVLLEHGYAIDYSWQGVVHTEKIPAPPESPRLPRSHPLYVAAKGPA